MGICGVLVTSTVCDGLRWFDIFFNASHVWLCVYISKWYALMCFCKSFIHLINNFDK